MGRDSYFICKTCKIYQYLGYGSYSSWNDMVYSIDEFIKKLPERDTLLTQSKNIRLLRLLVLHNSHEIDYFCTDWNTLDENKDLWQDGAYEPFFCYSMKDYEEIKTDDDGDLL